MKPKNVVLVLSMIAVFVFAGNRIARHEIAQRHDKPAMQFAGPLSSNSRVNIQYNDKTNALAILRTNPPPGFTIVCDDKGNYSPVGNGGTTHFIFDGVQTSRQAAIDRAWRYYDLVGEFKSKVEPKFEDYNWRYCEEAAPRFIPEKLTPDVIQFNHKTPTWTNSRNSKQQIWMTIAREITSDGNETFTPTNTIIHTTHEPIVVTNGDGWEITFK